MKPCCSLARELPRGSGHAGPLFVADLTRCLAIADNCEGDFVRVLARVDILLARTFLAPLASGDAAISLLRRGSHDSRHRTSGL